MRLLLLLTTFFSLFFSVPLLAQGSGLAAELNGSNQRGRIPDYTSLDHTGDLTIEFYLKTHTATTATKRYLAKWDGSGGDIGTIVIDNNGTNLGLRVALNNGSWDMFRSADNILTVNEWAHVALVLTASGTVRTYVNGEQVISGSFTPPLGNNGFHWGIGEDGDGPGSTNEYMDGEIDELRIWHQPLSQSEIRDWMCRQVTPEHPHYNDLKGYYRFEEGTGNQLLDSSPNQHHGNWINSPTYTTSAAPIGDAQSYVLTPNNGDILSLSHPAGDVLQSTITAAGANAVYLYRVDATPNNTTAPSGSDQVSQNHYYGLHIFGNTGLSYTTELNYDGHPGINNESGLRLATRADNTAAWALESSLPNTTANTLSLSDNTSQQFILASTSGDNGLQAETVAVTEFINDVLGNESTDEWLELYNYGNYPVNLRDWRIADEDADDDLLIATDYFIDPGAHVLVVKNQTAFENQWPDACNAQNVIELPGLTLANGGDEIIVIDNKGQTVWSLAYGGGATAGRATWYSDAPNFSTTVWGSKASPGVVFNGNDVPTATLGYEGNNHSPDPDIQTAMTGDMGSPVIYNNFEGDLTRSSTLAFDGSNEYVSVPYNAGLNNSSGELTLAAWVKRDATGSSGNVFVRGNYGYGLIVDTNDELGYWSNSSYGSCPNFGTVPANRWVHLAVVVEEGVEARFYIDGVLVGTTTNPAHTTINDGGTSDPLTIARQGTCNCNYFDGEIDELQIWHRALSAMEIREGMHLSRKGCEDGLVAYYSFDNGNGETTLSDRSGNGYDGSLVNMELFSDWRVSGVNVGNDVQRQSQSQTRSVPSGGSSQAFSQARLDMDFNSHSLGQEVTVTYQAFPPNSLGELIAEEIYSAYTWTLVHENPSASFEVDLTFHLPEVLGLLDTNRYALYWRAAYSDGDWRLLRNGASAVTSNSLSFSGVDRGGQFLLARRAAPQVTPSPGNMYGFDGTDDHIDISELSRQLAVRSSYSFEGWFKAASTQVDAGEVALFGISSPTGNDRVILFMGQGSTQNGRIYLYDGASTAYEISSTATFDDDQWHHWAYVRDGATGYLYLDGLLQGTHTPNYGIAATDRCLLGAQGNASLTTADPFTGAMDECRIWNTALSQDALRERLHLSLTGEEVDLLAYYQFNDDGSINSAEGVQDASPNELHGETVNMVTSSSSTSEVAVAAGSSDRVTVNSTGAQNFPNAGVSFDFSTAPGAELVVSRLNVRPIGGPSSGDVDNVYFVVRQFGGSTPDVQSSSFDNIGEIDAADVGANANVFRLYKRGSTEYTSTDWALASASNNSEATDAVAGTSGSVDFTNRPFSGFSQFVIVNTGSNSTLPLAWLHFQAERPSPQQVDLHWTTAQEENTSHFEIERMLDSEREFRVVGETPAAGNSNTEENYFFEDANAHEGLSYYRIKQVDVDGAYSYSEVRAVEGQAAQLAVFPNPVDDVLQFSVNDLPQAVMAQLQIINSIGQVVAERQQQLQSAQVVDWNVVKGLPVGNYYLRVQYEGQNLSLPFVKR